MPKIVLIGRPNVGKSTLFNRLVGRRLALVDNTPGVTRDRREGEAQLFDLTFTVVDTAGLEDAEETSLAGRMRLQTQAALREADGAVMVIDARAGITPLDRFFADWVRTHAPPTILVANKAESAVADAGVYESYALGLGDPIPISAEHGLGLVDLYHALCRLIEHDMPEGGVDLADLEAPTPGEADAPLSPQPEDDGPLKLAVIGRPNAGKSTLINRLLGEDRLLTGPEAGITRDSIAVPWTWQGRAVRLIDTAGLRKRAKVVDTLEKLSASDAKHAINFAEVVVLLLDATRGLEAQDLRIADQALQEGRALIIALNKWDVVTDHGALYRGVKNALEEGLSQVKGLSLLTVSGKTGKNLDVLMQAAFDIRTVWSGRTSTAALNRWLAAAVARTPPPAAGGLRIKLRYATQARTRPPTVVIWGTRTDALPDSYQRYLLNSLRQDLNLLGVPIRLIFKNSRNPFDAS